MRAAYRLLDALGSNLDPLRKSLQAGLPGRDQICRLPCMQSVATLIQRLQTRKQP